MYPKWPLTAPHYPPTDPTVTPLGSLCPHLPPMDPRPMTLRSADPAGRSRDTELTAAERLQLQQLPAGAQQLLKHRPVGHAHFRPAGGRGGA